MTNKTAKELLDKYYSGTITDAELAILENWYNQQAKINSDFPLSDQDIEEDLIKISNKLSSLKEATSHSHINRYRNIWYIAASILLISTLGISYLLISNRPERSDQVLTNTAPPHKKSNALSPGDKRALLTLADNTQIVLDNIESGDIKASNGILISKNADGQLIYEVSAVENNNGTSKGYNTISTPAGGEYQVKLSDGTLVWLNAKSSIKFPTIFSENERHVEITGEVYFDVSHNLNKPFVVETDGQKVRVLGTQFNINAYSKVKGIKTTLVEGSVLVQSDLKNLSKILKPGEESILDQNHSNLSVRKVDLESALAWKNGYFIFQDADLEEIMEQIARWYDADIEYATANRNIQFGGAISKYRKLPEVLSLLEMTEKVKFKIEGRRVIVMN